MKTMSSYPPYKTPFIPQSARYVEQVTLLLEVLPELQHINCFALKGGTAINLFFRDFSRLSIDIDLTYIFVEPRDIFLANLTTALENLADRIEAKGTGYKVKRQYTHQEHQLVKLIVIKNKHIEIKIEPNIIWRGYVFEPAVKPLSLTAKNKFFMDMNCLLASMGDVYAGKLCAALDRRHPRDLFDVKLLFENEGLTDEIRQAFVVYLASTDRPMHELLNYRTLDIKDLFDREFAGMAHVPVTCQELESTYQLLLNKLHAELTDGERQFLLSLKRGEPNWSLMPLTHLSELPGLKWKLLNIKKIDKARHEQQIELLKKALQL